MTRIISIVLVFCMLFGITVFAKELEFTSVPDEEKFHELTDNTLKDIEANKDDFSILYVIVNKYFNLREIYYKELLGILDKIIQVKDNAVKLNIITAFEKKYSIECEYDRSIQDMATDSVRYIKSNVRSFNNSQKSMLSEMIIPILNKYYINKSIVAYFHNIIQQMKEECFSDKLKNLSDEVSSLIKNKNINKAQEKLEAAANEGILSKSLYSKLYLILRDTEGLGLKVFVNGKRLDSDVKPKIINGRTMVPFKAICVALGISKENIIWDNDTKTCIIKRDSRVIQLKIGDPFIIIDDIKIPLDSPAVIENNRTLIPLKALSDALGAKASNDPTTEVVTVDDGLAFYDQEISIDDIENLGIPVEINTSLLSEKSSLSIEEVIAEINNTDESLVHSIQ